jgi:hypothetical protein
MALDRLSNHHTTWARLPNNGVTVTYHNTEIVRAEMGTITLRTDGHETVTTKRKMNLASLQFKLGFGVFQNDFVWFVRLPDDSVIPFVDGMSFEAA